MKNIFFWIWMLKKAIKRLLAIPLSYGKCQQRGQQKHLSLRTHLRSVQQHLHHCLQSQGCSQHQRSSLLDLYQILSLDLKGNTSNFENWKKQNIDSVEHQTEYMNAHALKRTIKPLEPIEIVLKQSSYHWQPQTNAITFRKTKKKESVMHIFWRNSKRRIILASLKKLQGSTLSPRLFHFFIAENLVETGLSLRSKSPHHHSQCNSVIFLQPPALQLLLQVHKLQLVDLLAHH